MVQSKNIEIRYQVNLGPEITAFPEYAKYLALSPHGQGNIDIINIIDLEIILNLVNSAEQWFIDIGKSFLCLHLIIKKADNLDAGPGDFFHLLGHPGAEITGPDNYCMPDIFALGAIMTEQFADNNMGKKDEKRGGKRPENKHCPGIAFRDLKDEEVEEKKTNHRGPGLQDHQKLKVQFPAAPGTIELKIMKAYKTNRKNNDLKPGIVFTPGYLVPLDKKPKKGADQ
jgi:hypothetical protein